MSELCQVELFRRRNRIAHWGYVSTDAKEAKMGHEIAVGDVAVLREMDRVQHAGV